MSDRSLTITLSDDLLRRLTAAAEAAGLSVEGFAVEILTAALAQGGLAEDAAAFQGAHDWTEADRRLADYDRTGESVAFEDWAADFRADVQARIAAKP
jgi:plasmid stability protein